jgi:hypothetical protein
MDCMASRQAGLQNILHYNEISQNTVLFLTQHRNIDFLMSNNGKTLHLPLILKLSVQILQFWVRYEVKFYPQDLLFTFSDRLLMHRYEIILSRILRIVKHFTEIGSSTTSNIKATCIATSKSTTVILHDCLMMVEYCNGLLIINLNLSKTAQPISLSLAISQLITIHFLITSVLVLVYLITLSPISCTWKTNVLCGLKLISSDTAGCRKSPACFSVFQYT